MEKDLFYFCTFTCWNWLSLIELADAYASVYKWFDWMNENQNSIIGYVIMPNHLHVIFYLSPDSIVVNKILGNAKRFLAYDIVKELQVRRRIYVLDLLQQAVSEKEKERNKKHQVFIPSSDIQGIDSLEVVVQKLTYIHNNPVAKRWRLAAGPVEYLHSSARYYTTGEQGTYPITDYRDIRFRE